MNSRDANMVYENMFYYTTMPPTTNIDCCSTEWLISRLLSDTYLLELLFL